MSVGCNETIRDKDVADEAVADGEGVGAPVGGGRGRWEGRQGLEEGGEGEGVGRKGGGEGGEETDGVGGGAV